MTVTSVDERHHPGEGSIRGIDVPVSHSFEITEQNLATVVKILEEASRVMGAAKIEQQALAVLQQISEKYPTDGKGYVRFNVYSASDGPVEEVRIPATIAALTESASILEECFLQDNSGILLSHFISLGYIKPPIRYY